MSKKPIRLGGASGFWGDSMLDAPQLVRGGKLDYLTFDYLAEVTMSILARARVKDPEMGYATDFVTHTLPAILKDCHEKGIRIIANAGGVNPLSCGDRIEELAKKLGLNIKVAVVTGDELLNKSEQFREAKTLEMFSGDSFPAKPMSINAYMGAVPIAEALAKGADIVITGRCVDSAVTLGACFHHFGWRAHDYDRLAGACLAGHVIECGAQATGGLFTDWEIAATDWDRIGYPIVEVSEDGSFVVSKPENTGGLVSVGTVAEQVVYEIGDPAAYILPDVICDFTEVTIDLIGKDEVRVAGAKGTPPTDRYKVSATYRDEYRLGLYVSIIGIDAARKARACGEAVIRRVNSMLAERGVAPLTETSLEVIGSEEGYGANARSNSPREVMLKLAAKHPIPMALSMMLREATSSGTSMAPGTTGMGGNRPKPLPVVRLFSFLLPKQNVPVKIRIGGETYDVEIPIGESPKPDPASDIKRAKNTTEIEPTTSRPMTDVPLIKLAFARSGDKGNMSNIGVIARQPEYLPWIRSALTAASVKQYFIHLVDGKVERFDLPGFHAINFLLDRALGGGGMASLRNDPQGKAMAQMLLDFRVPVPSELIKNVT